MDVEAFLKELKRDPNYAEQIAHVHTIPSREPEWGMIPDDLCRTVRNFIESKGVSRLYRHQTEAIEAALGGDDIMLATGTASGKSLCYQAPVLQHLLVDPGATALFVFPTKALARDQVSSWNKGLQALDSKQDVRSLMTVSFDADLDSGTRKMAQQSTRVLVTNPEMLHVRLLADHVMWARFFSHLRWVVLDEVHVYTGFFGANMANVIRRLSRICAHYGVAPQFACSSATMGDSQNVAERVTGRKLTCVDHDTSATGKRTVVFWNPPQVKARNWRGRRSANVEAHELMVQLVRRNISTICFSKARNTAEMIYRYVRDTLKVQSPRLVDRVAPYRGGYSGHERRKMEQRLRDGDLLGVSTTRALELGIDIGLLEACIVVGYPGTLNAFYQQIGRVGRGLGDSVTFLVGIDTLINQYIMKHPEFIFERQIERGVVDRDNPFVILGHLACSVGELPVKKQENNIFGYATELALEVLAERKKIQKVKETWFYTSSEKPATKVRLRGWGDESTVVEDADTGKIIDHLDKFRALRIFYPGAIYMHQGDTYAMLNHDTDRNIVKVQRTDVPYYTDPTTGTSVNHVDVILDRRSIGCGEACLGEVFAVSETPVYEKVLFYTLDRISKHEIPSPPVAYEAMSFWLVMPDNLVSEARRLGFRADSGMQGILFCVSRVLPLFLTSDSNDFDWSLGCQNSSPNSLFWYEFYQRGIGHSEQCFERLDDILHVALDHLLTCDCVDGCPNCTSRLITPYHTRNTELGEGTVESRRAAAVLLNSLLTGQSISESMALLEVSRPRGQKFLPTVTYEAQQSEPHQMSLGIRTRGLMLRKLDRADAPKTPIDHPIDPEPDDGIPLPGSSGRRLETNAETGQQTIRRTGNSLSRTLRKRLQEKVEEMATRELVEDSETDGVVSKEEEQPSNRVIEEHGSLSRRLRNLKRKRR